jgi:hypothetical protein
VSSARLAAWLAASGIETGPAFPSVDRHGRMGARRLSDRAVADMLKRSAAAVSIAGIFAGHSLRAGFATEGYAQGTPEVTIMRRALALGRRDARLHRGGFDLERQRRCSPRAVERRRPGGLVLQG